MRELVAYMYDREVGRFREHPDGRVVFAYSPGWLSSGGHALSVSLPLTAEELPSDKVESFIAGLLPDSIQHRKLLAAELDIEDDPTDFAFLSRLGRDCAGAITVVPEGESLAHDGAPYYEVLSESQLADYIRTLPQRPLLVDEDGGVLLSLAGVNDKAAVVVVDGKIAIPHYGFPTSHILKPDIAALPESIRVENFCLLLAKECGHVVPKTKIARAQDQVFMQMARYDRLIVLRNGRRDLVRLHQEDFCQALGYRPEKKYERKGGPGWRECFALMEVTDDPVASKKALLDRAIFQFLVGNPDAHAKNYSLLYRRDGTRRLAPFYDLNNAAAYRANFKKVKPLMAMAIGGEFDRTNIRLEHWQAFAEECGLNPSNVMARVRSQAKRMVESAPMLREFVRGTVADASKLDVVVEDVLVRAKGMLEELDRRYVKAKASADAQVGRLGM